MLTVLPLIIFSYLFQFSFVFQLEVLELLVQNGADLNAKNKHDETPAGKIIFLLWQHFLFKFLIKLHSFYRYLRRS